MSIFINGCGISGVVLAWILSRLTKGNLDISIVEFVLQDSQCSSFYSSRGIALSRNTYYKLISYGILPFLSSYSTPIKRIEIFDFSSNFNKDNAITISCHDYHISELGYVIELYNVRKKIFNFLNTLSCVKLFYPTRLQKIHREQSDCTVILDNGVEINAHLLIAADGSYSPLATLCGMEWHHLDYNQVAVITNITTSLNNEGCAFEIFTENGSLALLPLSGNRCSVIWCIPLKNKYEISILNTIEFCKKLQKIFGWRLGLILDSDKRYFCSLFLRKSKRHISHRLALVGNAAQTLHPIAGQGFNLGLRDITHLSEIIAETNMHGMDIGNYNILELYKKRRESDRNTIINITHNLIQLINNKSVPIVFMRHCSFLCVNRSILLRNILGKFLLSL